MHLPGQHTSIVLSIQVVPLHTRVDRLLHLFWFESAAPFGAVPHLFWVRFFTYIMRVAAAAIIGADLAPGGRCATFTVTVTVTWFRICLNTP